jgi:oligopeptide/dipeptide ABC transporter, ATP-binding protein, C-terminal domain
MAEKEPLLVVKDLCTSFDIPAGEVRSVAGISFGLEKGKILGIVGESGSGKSVTAASLMQILVKPGYIKSGSIRFNGQELVGMSDRGLRAIRGHKISMIFQDPMTALNPVFKIGHQMEEAILLHKEDYIDRLTEAEKRVLDSDENALYIAKNNLKVAEKSQKNATRAMAKGEKDVPDFKENIASFKAEIARLEAAVKIDRAVYETAFVKAKAQIAHEEAAAKTEYEKELAKAEVTLRNALRGRHSETYNEDARYENERADGLRSPEIRVHEKAADAALASKSQHEIAEADELAPLHLAAAQGGEGFDAAANQKAIDAIKAKYTPLIAADQKAYETAYAEAETARKQILAGIKSAHEIRVKEAKKRRHQIIKAAYQEVLDCRHRYAAKFKVTRWSAKQRSIEMLRLVGITNPEKRMEQYPFEFSGGMLQRVMIAMALLTNPDLLIADEPTTALDVTIQAQILELIKTIQKKLGMGVIIITHDLGVVAQVCDEVDVMYAGRIIERGTCDEIFYNPQHEYTKGLLASIPSVDSSKNERLHPIEGNPVDVFALPNGCSFAPRCGHCLKICLERYPAERVIGPGHISSCFYSAFQSYQAGKLTKEQLVEYYNQSFPIDTHNARVAKSHKAKAARKEK